MPIKLDLPGLKGDLRVQEVSEDTAKALDGVIGEFVTAIEAGAQVTARAHKDDGTLANGIESGRKKTGSAFFFSEGVEWFVRSSAPHSALFEYGSDERAQKKTGRRTGKMPKIGLIWPEYDARKSNFINSLRGLIR